MAEHEINREDKDFEQMTDDELREWAKNENVSNWEDKGRQQLIRELRQQNN